MLNNRIFPSHARKWFSVKKGLPSWLSAANRQLLEAPLDNIIVNSIGEPHYYSKITSTSRDTNFTLSTWGFIQTWR